MENNTPAMTKGKMLRQLRKEAKINQAVLAQQIGVCRETIINIEKDEPGAINSMSLEHTQKWFNACSEVETCTKATKMGFHAYIAGLFNM